MDPLRTHAKLLKVPLLLTLGVVVVFVGGALLLHMLRSGKELPVVEATAPAVVVDRIVFYKVGEEYALYFSLYDDAGREVARSGDVTIRISQLGTLALEGGQEFIRETLVLDSQFEVTPAAYRWIEVGSGLIFHKLRLVIPRRVPPEAFSKVPRPGAKCKISVQFRDGKVVESRLRQERVFLFP